LTEIVGRLGDDNPGLAVLVAQAAKGNLTSTVNVHNLFNLLQAFQGVLFIAVAAALFSPAVPRIRQVAMSKTNDPPIWIGFGIAILIFGFLFIDDYRPDLGVVWNILNSEIHGLPYKYIAAVGIACVFTGSYFRMRKSPRNSN
jgi:hypothetical protein